MENYLQIFITVLLTGIGTWLTKDYWDKRNRKMEHDCALFEKFILLLPSSTGVVQHLTDHDFGNSYFFNKHAPLHELHYEWSVPEKEFLTKDVERARKNLLKINDEFLDKLSLATAAIRSVGDDTLMGIHDPNQTIPSGQKERRDQAVVDVNKLADRWVEAYHAFTKLAKGRLLASSP